MEHRTLNPVALSSNRVAFVLPTERDSNSISRCITGTYDLRKREYCYEEGCFRGAISNREIAADNPVNTKRRELPLPAFSRYPQEYQRLTLTPSETESSLVSRRIPLETGPPALAPQEYCLDSLTLSLTDPFGLTTWLRSDPERNQLRKPLL